MTVSGGPSRRRPAFPPAGEPTDPELIRRFGDGDTEAFRTLIGRYERTMYNLAYRMLGNAEDARDATQDAFLSCYRHLDSFRGEAAFSTWLHRIAVNACFDALRRRTPVTSLEDRPGGEPGAYADHSEETAEAIDVQHALMAVPPEFRAVLVLHELQDLPVDSVAELLGLPVGTVKSRLHRGRVALARILGREPQVVPSPSNPPSA
jgi:RNA polymerase sigma-70 factor (ECF subfamily)